MSLQANGACIDPGVLTKHLQTYVISGGATFCQGKQVLLHTSILMSSRSQCMNIELPDLIPTSHCSHGSVLNLEQVTAIFSMLAT